LANPSDPIAKSDQDTKALSQLSKDLPHQGKAKGDAPRGETETPFHEDPHDQNLIEWKTCWEINLLFLSKSYIKNLAGGSRCYFCKDILESSQRQFWSSFYSDAVKCPRCGPLSSTVIVCGQCDEELVLNLSQRNRKCPDGDCDCFLTINEDAVRKRVGEKPILNQ
jgi:hypothetical protein